MLKKEFWLVIVLLLAVSFLSVAAGSENQQKFYFIEVPVLFHEHEQSKVEALGALQAAQKITTVEDSLQFDSALNNRLQFDAVTDSKTGGDALAEDQYRYYGHFDYTGKVGTTRAIQRIDLFQPFLRTDERLMFFDVRVGNDSHKNYEYNLGLGFREMASNRLINGFYAYLDGKYSPNRNLFHNITAGYELLFSAFEARINAYIPIGRRSYKLKEITHFYNHYFSVENKTVFQQTHHTIYEKSFGGFDIEIGGAVPYLPQANLYATYYRFMASGMDAIDGVRVRGSWEINPYFSMEASADFGQKNNQAKYIGFRITIPFGQAPEKPSTLERKMVSLPTRDIDIVSDEGKDSEIVDSAINDGLVPLLIGTELEDDGVKKDEKGMIVAAAASENKPVQTHYDGNAVFHGHHATEQHQAKYDALGHKGEVTHTRHHATGKGKNSAVKHQIIDLLENLYNDSSDESDYESDYESDIESGSDNSILSDASLPLNSDSSSDASSSFSSSQSFSSDSSSFNSSSSTSASSFPRRRESPKHRVRRYVSIFKEKPETKPKPPETPPSLPQEPIKLTSSILSNKDFSSDSLSSSSIDVETQTDLEDQAHQDKITELEGDRDKLIEDLRAIQKEKDVAQTELDQLRSNANSQETVVSELRGKLETQESRLSQLQQQKAGLEQTIEQLNKEIGNLTTNNNSLNTQLEANREKLGQEEGKLQNATGEVASLTESLQQAKTAKEAAERQKNDSETRANKLQEELSETNKKVKELEANNNNLTEANLKLTGENKGQAAELTKVRESLKEEQSKSTQLGGHIQERENTIQDQRIEQEQSTAEIERLQAENNQQQQKIAELTNANAERDRVLLAEQQARKTAENNLAARTQEFNNSQQELNQSLTETRETLRVETDKSQRLQQELVETKQRLTNTKIRNTKTIKRLRRDRANKSRVFTQTKNQLEQANNKLKTTTETLQAQMDSNETLSAQLNNQQAENKKLQDELTKAKQKPAAKSIATQTEVKMAITTKMGSKKPLDRIRVTDRTGKKTIIITRDSEINKYVVSIENHTTTSLIIDKDIMEKYQKLNLEQQGELLGQAYSYLMSADHPSLRFGTSQQLHQKGMGDPNNITAQQTTFLSKPPVLALPATNTQPWLQDNGKESRNTPIKTSHSVIKTKTIKDGDQHNIAGDLAISKESRNQGNTIKTIPSNTINASRSFSQDDLSLPKPQLQSNEQDLKNRLRHLLRTKNMPNLSITEAFVEAQVSSTKSSSVAETPEISTTNSSVDLLKQSTGDSTVVSSPSVSGLLTRSTSKENLGSPVQTTLKRASTMQPVRKKDESVNLRRRNSVVGNSIDQSPAKATELNIKQEQDRKGKDCYYVYDPDGNNKIFKRGIHRRVGLLGSVQYDSHYHIKMDCHRAKDIKQICKDKGFDNQKLTEDAIKKIMQALYPRRCNFN